MLQAGSLNVTGFNTRFIVKKLDLLEAFLMHSDIGLLFIIESWLNAKIPDSLFSQSGYYILRDDRLYGRGGGVLLLYKCSLNIHRFIGLSACSNKLFEFICADVHCFNSVIHFSSFYVPPYITASFNNFRIACEYLISCHTNNHPHFICGDFNLPSIDWTIPVSLGGVSSEYFVEQCCDRNFIQHVLPPTHDSGNILDLLLIDCCYATWLVSFEICSGLMLPILNLSQRLLFLFHYSKKLAMKLFVPTSMPLIGLILFLLVMTIFRSYMTPLFATYTT